MHLVWVPKHHPTPDLRSRLFATREKTNRKYEDDLFPSILELDPGTTKQGFLSFTYYSLGLKDDRWIEFSDWSPEDGLPTKFTPSEVHYFLLTVHDFVSGESIELLFPVLGLPSKRDMAERASRHSGRVPPAFEPVAVSSLRRTRSGGRPAFATEGRA
jgi:hypothetical protein